MKTAKDGAMNLVDRCLEYGESLAIVGDVYCKEEGSLIYTASKKKAKHTYHHTYDVDSSRDLSDALDDVDVIMEISDPSLPTIQKGITQGARGVKGKKFIYMPGFNKKMLETGANADYGEVYELTHELHSILKDCKEVKVTSEKGTNFTAYFKGFKQKRKWACCDAVVKKDQTNNFPCGEIFSSPIDMKGKVVIDGVLGNGYEEIGVLNGRDISFTVSHGFVNTGSIRCKDGPLRRKVKAHIHGMCKNSDRIGEVAIGTNFYIEELIGKILQDEKYPSVHIAWGNPLGFLTGAKWNSSTHCDGVILDTTVYIDKKKVMEDGKFIL